jgi:hypothetical protein
MKLQRNDVRYSFVNLLLPVPDLVLPAAIRALRAIVWFGFGFGFGVEFCFGFCFGFGFGFIYFVGVFPRLFYWIVIHLLNRLKFDEISNQSRVNFYI